MNRLQPHLCLLCFANDIMVHDGNLKYFLVQMQFVSLCFSKVDVLFGEDLYLLRCGVRRYELNLFCHTGVTSDKADVLVELMNHDFWFHCRSQLVLVQRFIVLTFVVQ